MRKRIDVIGILRDLGEKKELLIRSVIAIQAREGITTTRLQAENAVDQVQLEYIDRQIAELLTLRRSPCMNEKSRTLSAPELVLVRDALMLSLIHLAEHPSEGSPIRNVREALGVLNKECVQSIDRTEELEDLLSELLKAVLADDGSGAVLRPHPSIVERLRQTVNREG